MSDNEGIRHIHFNKQVLSRLTDFFKNNPDSQYTLHSLSNSFSDFNVYHYLVQLEKDGTLVRSKIYINTKPVTSWQLKKIISESPMNSFKVQLSTNTFKLENQDSECKPPKRLVVRSKAADLCVNSKEKDANYILKVIDTLEEVLIPKEESMTSSSVPSTSKCESREEDEFIKNISKNPVMILYEFATQKKMYCKMEVIKMEGPTNKPIITMAANLDGRMFGTVVASNKKSGKNMAAEVAIKTLFREGQFSERISNILSRATLKKNVSNKSEIIPTKNSTTSFEKMASMVYLELAQLLKDESVSISEAGYKVLSAVIMQDVKEDKFRVVSLATGNRCISSDKISLQGKVVNDCHAEIIARRSFLLFLYQQLFAHFSNSADSLGIFEEIYGDSTSKDSQRFRVKPQFRFHLYISSAPCGDGELFCVRENIVKKTKSEILLSSDHVPTFQHPVQGLLRSKIEGGEGTIPVLNLNNSSQLQTLDRILSGERLKTMSCSDKIARWNYLGIQGSLLSQFIQPLFLSSIFLGSSYDAGHLCRALCCRLEGHKSDEIFESSKVNHPDLGYVFLGSLPRDTENYNEMSINWSYGLQMELIDGTTGQLTGPEKNLVCSRIAKASLFHQYLKLFRAAGFNPFMNRYTYLEAKALSLDYESKKQVLYDIFQKLEAGSWIRKPVEQHDFKDVLYN